MCSDKEIMLKLLQKKMWKITRPYLKVVEKNNIHLDVW